ncbi:MAG: TylF/MycF family methyltransferase, partial [Oscillospiraceae bacterium]|nr:TylF/MycF family methyltransferase [Oscillospiraceae bacterium]
MSEYEANCKRIRNLIRNQIENGERNFIIYPYSTNGMATHDILKKQFGIEPAMIVDNRLCKLNPTIHPVGDLQKLDTKKYVIFLTSGNIAYCEEIRRIAYRIFPKDRVIDLFENVLHPDPRVSWLRKYSEIIYERGLSGSVAECGVFRGEFAHYINEFFDDRTCYLFDSFEGFAKNEITLEKQVHNSPFMTEENLTAYSDTCVESVIKRMPHPEKIVIKKGYVPDTLIGLEDDFCFVSLDMDFYLPMLEALKFFYPRMNEGGVLLLHDYYYQDLPGVSKAVSDYESILGKPLKKIPLGADPSIVIFK